MSKKTVKITEDHKVKLGCAAEVGGELIHVKTVITMPSADSTQADQIIKKFTKAHQEVIDMNQTALDV